jgi:GNAT superfamily N-acetyltransferase
LILKERDPIWVVKKMNLMNEKMKKAGLFGCNLAINYSFSYPAEEEELIRNIEIEFRGLTEETEDIETLAKVNIQMIPSPLYAQNCDEEEDMFLLMDGTSQDLCDVAEALRIYDMEVMEDCYWDGILNGDLFYISEFVVDKKYRGLGIGEILLKEIPSVLEYSLNLDVGIIALIASPIEVPYDEENKKEYLEARKKLFKFYEKNNYKLLNKDTGVMAYCLA